MAEYASSVESKSMTSSLTVSYYSEKGGLSLCIIKNLKVYLDIKWMNIHMNEHMLAYIFKTTVGLLVGISLMESKATLYKAFKTHLKNT